MNSLNQERNFGAAVAGNEAAAPGKPTLTPGRARRKQLQVFTYLFAATLATQLLSMVCWVPEQHVHMLWMPGGILLSALLVHSCSHWPTCVLGAAVGITAAIALSDISVSGTLLMTVGDCAMVLATACLIRHFGHHARPFEDFTEITRFIAIAVILLPMAGASWVAATTADTALADYVGTWSNTALARSLGYLLTVPAVISVSCAVRYPERRIAFGWRKLAVAFLLFVALAFVWYVPWNTAVLTPLLMLAPIPLLVWLLIAFGVAGTCAAMFGISILCMYLSLDGRGPFVIASVEETVLEVQILILGMAVGLLYLAALAEQKLSGQLMLRKAYRQLSEVTGRMLVVQEEERTRIARDLHDGINQSLAAISIQLSSLKRATSGAERETVADIQEQLHEVSNDIRSISHELHPNILRFTGLTSALQAFCDKHSALDRLEVTCLIGDLPHLSDDQELSLFRIVQEAINNIDKHAYASHAVVSLHWSNDRVVLAIEDNGIGYSPAIGQGRHHGLGMVSMEERARTLEGNFDIGRTRTGGTYVRVSFPAPGSPIVSSQNFHPSGT